jgi:hypothetical protein
VYLLSRYGRCCVSQFTMSRSSVAIVWAVCSMKRRTLSQSSPVSSTIQRRIGKRYARRCRQQSENDEVERHKADRCCHSAHQHRAQPDHERQRRDAYPLLNPVAGRAGALARVEQAELQPLAVALE